jgi:anti-sigma B factor antagonist
MSIQSKNINDLVYLSVSGDLLGENTGIELVDKINEYLNDIKNKKFVLDMSEARYVNSQGLGVLITSYTRVKNHGGAFVLVNPSEPIKKLLTITKLDSVFQIFNSLSEAETALK